MSTTIQVLICEDAESDVLLLVRELEKAKYTVNSHCVETASQMEMLLQKMDPDIILSDFNIPGFGAYEALDVLKRSGKDIPFVLVSGTIGEETAVNIMKAGANDYLMKGNLSRLGMVVKRELEEAENREIRRKAEEQIRANEEKYRAVIDNCLFAIFLVRPGGFIDEANEAACELFDCTQEVFRKSKLQQFLSHTDPGMLQKFIDANGRGSNDKFLGVQRSGERFYCEVSSVLFKSLNGTEMICVMVADISQRKNAERELIERNHELRRLSDHLKNAREDERKHISREIHDQIGQLASAIKMDLDWLNLHFNEDGEKSGERITRSLATVSLLIDTTRKIAASLRPGILDELGLNASLRWQCTEFENLNGIPCDFAESFDDSDISLEMGTELFRICQESLTNIMRHARANKVMVCLKDAQDDFALYIVDDGDGFDTNRKSDHLGLVGIRERAISLNGSLLIESEPGKGTTICVKIPKTKK